MIWIAYQIYNVYFVKKCMHLNRSIKAFDKKRGSMVKRLGSLSRLAGVLLQVFLGGYAAAAAACPDDHYESCVFTACTCLPKVSGDVGKASEAAKDTVNNVVKEVDKGMKNVSKEAGIAITNIGKNIEKGGKDIESNIAKSAKDVEAEVARAGKDTEQAVSAIGRYLERSVNSTGAVVQTAAERVREGKVVDAVWHMGIDHVRASSKNAALAATESSVLNTVAQVSATAYGGPQGAAAYAAWLTYEQTGDVGLAVKVGVIAGASALAMAEAGKMPSTTEYELAKKAIVTGAIGGSAVAAAGGNEDAVTEGFLKAGAMVVIQDTYQRKLDHKMTGKASKGDPYCMTVSSAGCAPPAEAFVRKADGSLDLDSNGIPKIDMSKVDKTRPAVGIKDPRAYFNENNLVMKGVSKVPGMNDMAVFHDQWAMKWNMGSKTTAASIVPAVVVTYWGLGAPYYTGLQETAVNAKRRDLVALNTKLGIEPKSNELAPSNLPPIAESKSKLSVNVNDIVQSYFCNVGDSVRVIAVERPAASKGDFACRVLYAKEDGEESLWRAENDGDYCAPKALKFAKRQKDFGFSCVSSAMNRPL